MKYNTELIDLLLRISAQFHIRWDRFSHNRGDYYQVYGWATNTDGERDFLLIDYYGHFGVQGIGLASSNDKLGKQITEYVLGTSEDYILDQPISELSAQLAS